MQHQKLARHHGVSLLAMVNVLVRKLYADRGRDQSRCRSQVGQMLDELYRGRDFEANLIILLQPQRCCI
jgi:hypothetical protein